MSVPPKERMQVKAADVPPPIQWHEGMLLEPHHFQQLSRRHELLVHYHAAAVSPFHWGVRHLDVDPVALGEGVFKVVQLEGVMRDGLVATYAAGEQPELKIDLTPRRNDMKKGPVTVHLAVVARGGGLAFDERYASLDGDDVADENTGRDKRRFAVLKPKLQLMAGDEPPSKYISMPLAKIEHSHETYARAAFEPPLLRVAQGSELYKLCTELAARLRDKATSLAEQVRAPSPSSGVTKILVHCLAGELPPFEALLGTGVSHPFPLYVALCSLLGHVSGLGRALVPPVLEPYNHNDLLASFRQVSDSIAQSVSEGTNDAYKPHPFVLAGEAFRLPFDRSWSGRRLLLAVRAPSGVSDHDMAAWVARSVISSRGKLVQARDERVTGAPRKRIDADDDADFVAPRGTTLYMLTGDSEYIQPGEDLIVINPGDGAQLRPDSIVLFVRNPT